MSRTTSEPLASLVAAAPGSLVLPPGDRRAAVDVAEPLRLLASYDVGGGRFVAVVEDATADRWTVPLVVADGRARRAAPGDGVAEALVRRIADGLLLRSDSAGAGASDRPEGRPFVVDSWWAEDVRGERGITVDQTNESVVVGERAMVKWSVRLPRAGVRGSQPAAARLASLSAAEFRETPRPWGLLHWGDHEQPSADQETVRGDSPDALDPGRQPSDLVLLASVTEFLPGALDGWDWMVDDVRRAARGEATLDDALAGPKRLGSLTARMHVALAANGVEVAGGTTVAHWTQRALADLDEAVRVVEGPEGERLRSRARRITSAYDAFAHAVGTPLIDVHGDYHVGQVLRHHHEDPTLGIAYAVTDFDGNPVVAPEERSARQPAALDVAGMLASLDHVGRVVIRRTEGVDVAIALAWIDAAQRAFRDDYVDTLARLRHDHLLDERLLLPLRLAQEVREHLYAVAHLPHWVYVPDAALDALLPDRYH